LAFSLLCNIAYATIDEELSGELIQYYTGPRHGEVPPPSQSKIAAPPSHGLKQSQAFQDGIIS